MKQAKALAILKSGRNVFLTGSAGTGKTYVLNQYIEYLRNRKIPVAITASTGIAATHMNGQTIHSWCGMGVRDSINGPAIKRLLDKKYLQKNITNAKVLIIDEISMLHRRQLDMVNEILQVFRQNREPFGGIQVVLSGDFFQLPPVTRNEETNREKFCFMSSSWMDANMMICYLHEQYRQTDNQLNEILNEIRSGSVTAKSEKALEEAMYNRFKVQPTRLYSHNMDVDRINQQELESVAGEPETYESLTKGNEALVDMLKKSVLAPDVLDLKEGCRVMFVKNNYDKYVMNGTLGTVRGYDDETGFPVVETDSGNMVLAEPEVWSMEDEKGKTLASLKQVPLRLAWAITVHKSQGMTLDSAEIDLTKTFEKGQGYVALSRLKHIDGLRLLGYNSIALEVDDLAMKADSRFQQLSESADSEFEFDILEKDAELFVIKSGGLVSEKEISKHIKKKEAKIKGLSTFDQTLDLYNSGKGIDEISEIRGLKTSTIINHLVRFKNAGKELDLSRLEGTLKNEKKIRKAYEEVILDPANFQEDGKSIRLKVLFDSLEGKVSYDDLHLFQLLKD
ncbi:MAG: AAA family ATPase [Bacteroidetes bacterium]|nr:AAA family ATPase [Bacteroidota bacterium]